MSKTNFFIFIPILLVFLDTSEKFINMKEKVYICMQQLAMNILLGLISMCIQHVDCMGVNIGGNLRYFSILLAHNNVLWLDYFIVYYE